MTSDEDVDNKQEWGNDSEEILSDDYIYNCLLKRAGEKLEGPKEAVEKFETVYRKLHTAADKIGLAYKEVCQQQFRFNPGKVDIVLGGGRIKGKPLAKSSDLDLFIFVENPKESIDLTAIINSTPNPLEAMDRNNLAMLEIIDRTEKICKELEIPNLFHIMQYSSSKPDQYNNEKQLLLATID